MDIALQLDQTDRAILNHLQAHAKLTNAQLAQHIGLSPASTLERVRKLESRGIIKSYHAKLAPQKLALHTCMLVQIKLQHLTAASITAFKEVIGRIPEVVECHQVVGDADFLLKVVTTDITAYQQLVMHQLSAVKDIQHMKPFVITATIKEAGMPIKPAHTAAQS